MARSTSGLSKRRFLCYAALGVAVVLTLVRLYRGHSTVSEQVSLNQALNQMNNLQDATRDEIDTLKEKLQKLTIQLDHHMKQETQELSGGK